MRIAFGIALGSALFWFSSSPGSQSHTFAADEIPRPADVEFFEQKVRPILVSRCYDCHGPDSGEGEGGLRLDARSSLIRGGNSGSALVPGKPDQSLIVLAVQHDPSLAAMPPKAKLKPEEIQSLVRWVERGAEWPKDPQAIERTNVASVIGAELSPESLAEARRFWAFVPPVEPDVPFLWTNSRPRSPVDVLILGRLERAEITPAREADRRTRIRRATFDLLGLPPDPDDVDAFVANNSRDAFSRLVDRLLESPRYGERWGRHWLDSARYADTNGMDDNVAWSDAWRYRDYVIDAFNRDLPYDQFVREQIAGDLVAPPGDARHDAAVIATGFLMVGPKFPSADDPVKQQLDIVDEQLDTTGRVFLALTLGCARCHDHKYDPFPSADYYGLAGIFQSTTTMLSYRVDSKFNLVALGDPAAEQELSRLEREFDRHDDVIVNGSSLKMTAEERQGHQTELNRSLAAILATPTAMAVEEGTGVDLPVMVRGNHLTKGRIVPRRIPPVLLPEELSSHSPAFPKDGSGRRELANWLTDPRNPLTARVMVNRVWAWHFGQGLVRSVDNFGQLGDRPDHAELLDWLALRFIESGWSVKSLHRLIMNSAVYQMAGTANEEAALADPENRLLWRFSRRRHSAEVLRDTLLATSGRLDSRMGGRTLPIDNHKIMSTDEIAKCNQVFAQPRRTIYLPVVRSGLADVLTTFDYPDPGISTGRRETTTVAPQALFLLNSPLALDSAVALADRCFQSADSDEVRVTQLFRAAFQRLPTSEEREQAQSLLDELSAAPAPDQATRREAWISLCRVLLSSNEFVYAD